MKEINGCDKDSPIPDRWIIRDYRLKRCPMKEVTSEGLEYLRAYKFYKNGVLPAQGGWLNQTNTFIQAVEIIDTEIGKIEALVRKEHQK